jgi:DNA helicase HerA-like ATPase
MTVQLIGESSPAGRFTRGVSQYPTVGDAVHLVSQDDLRRLYGRPDEPRYLAIGQVASAESIPALIDVNQLVNRHSAVVGSTGSGKSTSVASILSSIVDVGRFPAARVLLIDLHGEYAAAFGSKARVFRINADAARGEMPLYLPYWALEFDELVPLTFGSFANEADRGGVAERIRQRKLETLATYPKRGAIPTTANVDAPVPFSIHKLWYDLYLLVSATHTQTGNQSASTVAYRTVNGIPVDTGDALQVRTPDLLPQDISAGANPKVYLSQSQLNIRRQLDGLAYRLRDGRFDFLFRPGKWLPAEDGNVHSDLDALLEDWLDCRDRPITILDLSGVPREIIHVVVGVVLRIVYDALFWARNLSEGGRERPLLVVLEEAHAYLAKDDAGPAAKVVRRIVREGRKYGIGAMIVSQRPSEIDPTILSQCGTTISLRLTNSTDRSQVTAAAQDNLEGLFSLLPILRTGEAIVVGDAVHIPTRVLVRPPPVGRRPASEDPVVFEQTYAGGWNRKLEEGDYGEVIERWRRQNASAKPG